VNQDDELTPRFNDFGNRAMESIVPAGPEAVRAAARRRRARAVAASALAIAVIAVGGAWLGSRIGRSAGPPAASVSADAAPVTASPADPGAGTAPSRGAAPSAGASTVEGVPVDGNSAAAALPRCHTGDLDARFAEAAGGAAAGSVYLDLGLTNHSSHPCRIYGFPGMSLIDAAGRWLPTTLSRDPVQPALVTLAPGQTAWAMVHYAHVPADDETFPCQPAAAGLVVTPPDETTQLTIDVKLTDVCQHGRMGTAPMAAQRPRG
jgi:hypothetical protein